MDGDSRDLQARLASYRAFQDKLRQGGLADEVAEAERARGRRRRVVLACVAGVVVLLAACCSGVRLTVLPERQARAVALAYLEGLADSAAWLAVVDAVAPEVIADLPQPVSDGTRGPAMLGQLVRSAPHTSGCLPPTNHTHSRGMSLPLPGCYTPPTDIAVTDVAVDGQHAVVSVAFGFAGDDQRYTGSLRLRRDTGAAGTILARWVVVDGFGTLDIGGVAAGLSLSCIPPEGQPAVSCVALDGLPVALAAGNQRSLTVLPGRHQLELHLFNPFRGVGGSWQSTVYTVVVPPGGRVAAEAAV